MLRRPAIEPDYTQQEVDDATVETTGGAILGESTMSCIVHRIERGRFEPPHGGGTIRVRVPFSLRRVLPGEET
jgi:hypothetical protein